MRGCGFILLLKFDKKRKERYVIARKRNFFGCFAFVVGKDKFEPIFQLMGKKEKIMARIKSWKR